MNDIPCDVAKDLMPSYIDGMTSGASNALLEAHVAGCEDCRRTLQAMRTEEEIPGTPDRADAEEIDFLKKNRKRNRIILAGAVLSVLCFLALFCVRVFFIGEPMYGAINIFDIRVEGNHLSIQGEARSNAYYIVKGFSETEQDGIVTFTTRGRRRLFFMDEESLTFNADYYYDTDIHTVCLDGRIIWHDGARISALASDVYETRHDYMGDMPANQKTANILNLGAHFGPYENELKSDAAPLTWRLLIKEDIPSENREDKERLMHSFAYMMLAVIGNLDAVEFVYDCDGEALSTAVTKEDASAFFGQDVKNCMTSARLTDELLHRANLDSYSYFDSTTPPVDHSLRFGMRMDTEEEISYITFALFRGDALVQSGGGMNADETPLLGGDTMWFDIEAPAPSQEEMHLEFIIHTTDGKEHRVADRIVFPNASGTLQTLILTGNAEEGFRISQ